MIVVVYHDQLCSGKTGSVPKIESGPNSREKFFFLQTTKKENIFNTNYFHYKVLTKHMYIYHYLKLMLIFQADICTCAYKT